MALFTWNISKARVQRGDVDMTIREYVEEVREIVAIRVNASVTVEEIGTATTIYIKSRNAGRHYCVNNEYTKGYSIDECADHICDLQELLGERR